MVAVLVVEEWVGEQSVLLGGEREEALAKA